MAIRGFGTESLLHKTGDLVVTQDAIIYYTSPTTYVTYGNPGVTNEKEAWEYIGTHEIEAIPDEQMAEIKQRAGSGFNFGWLLIPAALLALIFFIKKR